MLGFTFTSCHSLHNTLLNSFDTFLPSSLFFICQEYAKVLQKREEDRLAKKHQDLLEQKAAPQPVSFIFTY